MSILFEKGAVLNGHRNLPPLSLLVVFLLLFSLGPGCGRRLTEAERFASLDRAARQMFEDVEQSPATPESVRASLAPCVEVYHQLSGHLEREVAQAELGAENEKEIAELRSLLRNLFEMYAILMESEYRRAGQEMAGVFPNS